MIQLSAPCTVRKSAPGSVADTRTAVFDSGAALVVKLRRQARCR